MIRFLVKVVHFQYHILNAFKFRNGFGFFSLPALSNVYKQYQRSSVSVANPGHYHDARISVLMIILRHYI
jgi:hypothetical protein